MEPLDGGGGPRQATVDVQEESDWCLLVLSGEFDLVTAEILEETLERVTGASPGVVVLDMAQVSFIDSSGLKPLIRAHARGTTLRVRSASPTVQAVISLTGLDKVLPLDR
jgi:anti-anti-sigma factor